MSESEESGAFEPTVIENATLGLSQLDKDLVDEAVRQGLITKVQGQMVLESVVSADTPQGSGTETVALMVDRGLIPKDKAEELLDSLTEEFVPGYRLGRELGRGAMGVVYEATQKKLGRRVALKVVNPALSSNADYVKRFKREAQTLAKLNHPNIVQLYDFGEANGRIFLALEFVEGEDVSGYMEREGQVPERTALQIVRDVALGLSHGHQYGVVHRDVKPANLLLLSEAKDADGKDFTTKVTDFGLAREQEHKGDGELTQEGTILGTPAYMAPEQTEGVAACHKCDIYALGATLYHMLTGQVPFQASSVVSILLKKQTERLENPQIKAPELSSQAVRLLDRMLSKTPAERYQDYQSLLTDVDLVLEGQDPSISPLAEEHSSLQLSALVQTTVRPVQLPSGRAPKAAGEGSYLPLVGLIAVVGLLIGAYVALKGSQSLQPTPTPSVAVQPSLSPRAKLEANLATLSKVKPASRAGQVGALSRVSAMIAALPEGDRDRYSIEYRGLVDEAIEATEETAQEALSKAWKSGDYGRLADQVQSRRQLLGLAESPPSAEFLVFERRTQAAAEGEGGTKERALWAEIEAGWEESPRDISGLLAKFDEMSRYSAFSPELETVASRRLELEASAPEVELFPVPATAILSVDGEKQGAGPFKGRLIAGTHTIKASAEGFRDYERTLELKSRISEQLHLAPLRKKALKIDPNNTARRRPVLNPRNKVFWEKVWRREAGGSGEWSLRDKEIPTGLDGSGSRLGASVVTNRLFGSRCVDALVKSGAAGWSLSWRIQPFQGSSKDEETKQDKLNPVGEAQVRKAAAEVRLLKARGGELAIGFDRGQVYVGLRQADGLYRRWSEVYPAAPPQFYRVDWDGDVAEVFVKETRESPWRFFHSLRLTEASRETLSLAVLDGRVLFSDFSAPNALVPE